MAAIKLQKFLGIAPRVSAEQLPDGAGQVAHNVKLYSGDLLPYREPTIADSTERTIVVKTLHGLRDSNNDVEWLSWITDVDIVIASDSSDDEQRIYYSGDGAPKVTTYDLATTSGIGTEPYPVANGFYDLGLPLPTVEVVAISSSFTSPTSTHFERDSGNTGTITTSAAHNLRTGNIVSIRDFTGTVPETFNATNVQVTVITSTTFEYYSAGDAVTETSDTNGVVDLSGSTITRDYTYTWFTPWDEESIGAVPSNTLFIKEGQTVNVTAIPTAAPAGNNFIHAVKLYRTLTGPSGSEFYNLSTLWFPQTTTTVSLTSNVATVTMSSHHGFIVGDRFKLRDCTDSVFNITDGIVTVVVSDTAFSYAVTNANIGSKADTTGKLYHDIAELTTDDARYWQDYRETTQRVRSSNVSTLTTSAVHGLSSGNTVTISAMGDATYNATDVQVTVVDTTHFSYPNTGTDESITADTAGVITFTGFTDDFDFLNLVDLLVTDDYDKPNENMIGIILAQNNMVAGFFDNQLCFAEPGKPHAWPIAYRQTIEYNIVGLAAVGGTLIVLTEEYAYRVAGSDPLTLSIARIDTRYPCLSKRSIVNMGYGVVYATHGGLALWSPNTGLTLATKYIYDWDIWNTDIAPATLVGKFYEDKYFGTHSTGSFIFERDEKVGGYFVTVNDKYDAAWLDPLDDAFYYTEGTEGIIYEWDAPEAVLASGEWKSKVFVTKDYINIGAARVIGDYGLNSADGVAITAFNATLPALNLAIWGVAEQLGTLNGPTDYIDGVFTRNNHGEINSTTLNGDNISTYPKSTAGTYSVTFKLYQNKSLIFTTTVASDDIFRCPSGYKSDTFEVEVSGRTRVRSVHIGETPDGLREA
jgi:hypothetical protein